MNNGLGDGEGVSHKSHVKQSHVKQSNESVLDKLYVLWYNCCMMEKVIYILPVVIMVECFLASIPLVVVGKYGSALYWFSAGLLNSAVIFGIKRMG